MCLKKSTLNYQNAIILAVSLEISVVTWISFQKVMVVGVRSIKLHITSIIYGNVHVLVVLDDTWN